MTIVVGYLATPEGRAALEAAIEEAERRSTGLLLVVTDRGTAGTEAAADQARALEEVRRELDSRGVPFDVRESSQGRDVAEDLIGAAEGSDGTLIVIGLRRRSPVGKLILGVNAQRILLDAPCPVLAVKPRGNEASPAAVETP
jgi:nucleotide-binding universal stress UspA family protein